MSKRKPSLFIQDILTCIDHIVSYTGNLSFADFSLNYMAIEACLYNIQVIGEAVTNLPETLIASEPQIPWALIRGMRNRLIHEYFGTDLLVVWNVITKELPDMKIELNRILVDLKKGE